MNKHICALAFILTACGGSITYRTIEPPPRNFDIIREHADEFEFAATGEMGFGSGHHIDDATDRLRFQIIGERVFFNMTSDDPDTADRWHFIREDQFRPSPSRRALLGTDGPANNMLQVALGGSILGLEFSEFGYWHSRHSTGTGANSTLVWYNFMPVFGGRNDMMISDISPQSDASFRGNATALFTFEHGDADNIGFHWRPVAGDARFDLASNGSHTLRVDFDRWYTMTFTGDGTGAARVHISKRGDFEEANITVGQNSIPFAFPEIGDRGDSGLFAFQFFGANGTATEAVGGFQYLQDLSTSDIRRIFGIVGGFGALLVN